MPCVCLMKKDTFFHTCSALLIWCFKKFLNHIVLYTSFYTSFCKCYMPLIVSFSFFCYNFIVVTALFLLLDCYSKKANSLKNVEISWCHYEKSDSCHSSQFQALNLPKLIYFFTSLKFLVIKVSLFILNYIKWNSFLYF